MYYTYILGSDKRHYVGSTENIKRRVEEHKRGQTRSTRSYQHIELLGFFIRDSKKDALLLEKTIKNSGHIARRTNHPDFVVYDIID